MSICPKLSDADQSVSSEGGSLIPPMSSSPSAFHLLVSSFSFFFFFFFFAMPQHMEVPKLGIEPSSQQ